MELLVVVLVLAVLAAVAVPATGALIDRSRDRTAAAELEGFARVAWAQAALDEAGVPTSEQVQGAMSADAAAASAPSTAVLADGGYTVADGPSTGPGEVSYHAVDGSALALARRHADDRCVWNVSTDTRSVSGFGSLDAAADAVDVDGDVCDAQHAVEVVDAAADGDIPGGGATGDTTAGGEGEGAASSVVASGPSTGTGDDGGGEPASLDAVALGDWSEYGDYYAAWEFTGPLPAETTTVEFSCVSDPYERDAGGTADPIEIDVVVEDAELIEVFSGNGPGVEVAAFENYTSVDAPAAAEESVSASCDVTVRDAAGAAVAAGSGNIQLEPDTTVDATYPGHRLYGVDDVTVDGGTLHVDLDVGGFSFSDADVQIGCVGDNGAVSSDTVTYDPPADSTGPYALDVPAGAEEATCHAAFESRVLNLTYGSVTVDTGGGDS